MEVEFRLGHRLGERRSELVSKARRHNRSGHSHDSVNCVSQAGRSVLTFLGRSNEEFKVVTAPFVADADLVFPGSSFKFNRSVGALHDFSSLSAPGSVSLGVVDVTLADGSHSTGLAFNNKPV